MLENFEFKYSKKLRETWCRRNIVSHYFIGIGVILILLFT